MKCRFTHPPPCLVLPTCVQYHVRVHCTRMIRVLRCERSVYLRIPVVKTYERWEVLIGIRLLGTICWRGASHHQGCHCTDAFGGNETSCRVPTPLRSTSIPLSLTTGLGATDPCLQYMELSCP